MGMACFIVDALLTGAQLPRHLRSIRQSGLPDHLVPIIVTNTCTDARLALLEQRYHVHGLITPPLTLGARLNQAAYISQSEWLLIALHKTPMAAPLWIELYPQLDTYALDALMIGSDPRRFSERLLQHFLGSTVTIPPYIAIRWSWLERLGGFDPELDESALVDFLQRIYACPTRIRTISSAYSAHNPGLTI
ncbi:hypothetical protein [Vreelandella olivaria]|uniref:hypothetical protein n=1 Tax=Vreelandella olivaria TaxID=390919 RepID=UPI00201F93FD|nr:hypothetical protein [Halomonas olivaria]